MINIEGTNIELSKGDTFSALFQIENYIINPTDTVIFTIKQSCMPKYKALIKKQFTGITDNSISVEIEANEIEKIGSGTKLYDIVVETKSGTRTTLLKPSKFHLHEVVHDLE